MCGVDLGEAGGVGRMRDEMEVVLGLLHYAKEPGGFLWLRQEKEDVVCVKDVTGGLWRPWERWFRSHEARGRATLYLPLLLSARPPAEPFA